MFREFKEFALKGNVLDMAVGIIIGAAFGTIVKSLVSDIIMPPFGLVLGNVDFTNLFVVLKHGLKDAGPYATLKDAESAGAVTINYGLFVNNVISFVIVAFSIFIVIKGFQRLKRKDVPAPAAVPATKECPFCLSQVPAKAAKCAYCTSELSNQ